MRKKTDTGTVIAYVRLQRNQSSEESMCVYLQVVHKFLKITPAAYMGSGQVRRDKQLAVAGRGDPVYDRR